MPGKPDNVGFTQRIMKYEYVDISLARGDEPARVQWF